MNKYIFVLSLMALSFVACSQDDTMLSEENKQNSETPQTGYYSIDIPIQSPEIIDLEANSELRALPTIGSNGRGYPIIKLPSSISGNIGQQLITIRWRPVSRTNNTDLFEAQGVTLNDGAAAGNSAYGSDVRMTAKVETYGDRQVLRVFAPYSSSRTGWWGNNTNNRDVYAYLTYGVQVAGGQLGTYRYERAKHYYGSGLIYPDGTDTSTRGKYFGYDVRTNPSANTAPRKIYLATESVPHQQMIFPMLTVPTKGVLKTKEEHREGTTMNNANIYTYLTIQNTVLKARGTIMGLNFKNETGRAITIRAVEVKNDAFAYDGYFGLGAQAFQWSIGDVNMDGYAPSAIVSNEEVKNGTPLKFVETNKCGASQYTLTAKGLGASYMPTSQEFQLYANASTQGVAAAVGAVTNGRFFLWGFPKNGGTTPWTVRVKYRVSGSTTDVLSKPQRVTPPAGGFQESKAYLTTIRVRTA